MTPAQTPVDQFSAVADPTRCRVIEMLSERAMPVHELTAACAHHGDPATDSMSIRPPIPWRSGHLFHEHPAALV